MFTIGKRYTRVTTTVSGCDDLKAYRWKDTDNIRLHLIIKCILTLSLILFVITFAIKLSNLSDSDPYFSQTYKIKKNYTK